jgi:phosphatidylglycerophosphatase A
MPTQSTDDAPRHTLAVWLATGFGVGLAVPAPGTFGALWGLPLAWGYAMLPGQMWPWVAATAVLALGVPVCGRAAADLKGKDPGPVVWDEFSTVPLVFLLVPFAGPWTAAAGFGLHRLFDIAKPWPCHALEKLPGGWGIMADDVAAALYAAVALWALSFAWS